MAEEKNNLSNSEKVAKTIAAVIKSFNELKNKTEKDIFAITEKIREVSNRKQNTENEVKDASKEISHLNDRIKLLYETLYDGLKELDEKILNIKLKKGDKGDPGASIKGEPGQPGISPNIDEVAEKASSLVLKEISPELEKKIEPEKVRDALETLEGDERLDRTAIKGLEELEKTFKDMNPNKVRFWGRSGFQLMVDGIKKGLVQSLDIEAGPNVTIDHTNQNGLHVLTISAGGGNIYTETPSGLINGVNVTYTTVHSINTLIALIINGQFLHPTADYSFTGNTITLTSPLDSSLNGRSFTVIYS